ncbi:peptidoglycan-binding domain-containing protein [Falsiphaeobacter marinintestinus]|uniref:peptidoglycan-binding domain-containing protein n=1 Tax=Falsiphaeobacter marinintestinus TaxID=1492905 RepID=UPI0011B79E05|nr:peptidoglycan-binding domain-containing protein [Phaeobacter marinintestinus]
MFTKSVKTVFVAVLIANGAWAPARADNLGAAIVGGIIGGAIVHGANKSKKKTYSSKKSYSSTYSAQRQQNREMQTALNYFSFPAGSPDGVIGGRTRTAASQYQLFMGYPATGTLTQYERDFLVASMNRAQIGGPEVIKAMQGPGGVRGLLLTWRDEAAGIRTASSNYGGLPTEVSQAIDEIADSSEPSAEQLLQRSGFLLLADMNGDGKNDYVLDTSVTGSSFWCGASHCSVMVFTSTPQGYQRSDFQARGVTTASFSCHQSVCRLNETPQTQLAAAQVPAQPVPVQPQQANPPTTMAAAEQPAAGLPVFSMAGDEAPQASLASRCSKVSLLTNTNGGYVTLASMTDPELALGEQFCLTRTYAIGAGENMIAKVQGASQDQIDAQCDGFGPVLEPFVGSLTSSDSQSVRGNVQKFALNSNMSLEQLATTGKICLFSGYRRDKMNVALGSALVLVGIGETPYAELIGHHLSQGFGVAQSSERAQDWYAMAVSALETGAEPVFAPGQPERVSLIKAAAQGLTGTPQAAIPAPSAVSALPTFSLD